jgi:hypothetical protein
MAEPTGIAGARFLSNVVDDLYTFLKDKAALTINRKKVEEKLSTLDSHMQNVRLVKTLWQVDTAVDVESFYCDSHVIFPATKRRGKQRKKIDTVSDFGAIKHIVISGTAGQGKSIFLRHLCVKECEACQRIPIFVELRRIQNNETLLNYISHFLDILDLPVDDKLFKILLQSGKFIFFFDGFDEIPEVHKQSILNELENLCASSQDTQFLITTRPNTAILMSPFFNVVTLDDLRGTEYKTVIRKLSSSPGYADNLIKTIAAHKANVAALLCNPLLVTLLLISYKSFQKLPEKLADFYESIFYALLSRHDGTKPGFIRQRRCAINDNQYREIFDAFCFESKKTNDLYLGYQEIYRLVERSIERVNLKEDADKYLRDIKDVTCLILQEGEEYRFIHKSVQEYYAASFIRNRSEDAARLFYSKCLADFATFVKWRQELEFLAEIDQYRHHKYYLIPLCHKWLNTDNDDELLRNPPKITTELTVHIIGSFSLDFDLSNPGLVGLQPDTISQILGTSTALLDFIDEILILDYTELHRQLVNGKISINEELLKRNYFISHLAPPAIVPRPERGHEFELVIQQVMEEGYFTAEFNSVAAKILDSIYKIWKQAYSYVNRENSLNMTFEMDI